MWILNQKLRMIFFLYFAKERSGTLYPKMFFNSHCFKFFQSNGVLVSSIMCRIVLSSEYIVYKFRKMYSANSVVQAQIFTSK